MIKGSIEIIVSHLNLVTFCFKKLDSTFWTACKPMRLTGEEGFAISLSSHSFFFSSLELLFCEPPFSKIFYCNKRENGEEEFKGEEEILGCLCHKAQLSSWSENLDFIYRRNELIGTVLHSQIFRCSC